MNRLHVHLHHPRLSLPLFPRQNARVGSNGVFNHGCTGTRMRDVFARCVIAVSYIRWDTIIYGDGGDGVSGVGHERSVARYRGVLTPKIIYGFLYVAGRRPVLLSIDIA